MKCAKIDTLDEYYLKLESEYALVKFETEGTTKTTKAIWDFKLRMAQVFVPV